MSYFSFDVLSFVEVVFRVKVLPVQEVYFTLELSFVPVDL